MLFLIVSQSPAKYLAWKSCRASNWASCLSVGYKLELRCFLHVMLWSTHIAGKNDVKPWNYWNPPKSSHSSPMYQGGCRDPPAIYWGKSLKLQFCSTESSGGARRLRELEGMRGTARLVWPHKYTLKFHPFSNSGRNRAGTRCPVLCWAIVVISALWDIWTPVIDIHGNCIAQKCASGLSQQFPSSATLWIPWL